MSGVPPAISVKALFYFMKIIRTDGCGTFNENERLISLRNLFNHFGLEDKIDLLHDHKGYLEINWIKPPTIGDLIIASRAWNGFNEYDLQHKFNGIDININIKSFDL
jgi:hypothetical protein